MSWTPGFEVPTPDEDTGDAPGGGAVDSVNGQTGVVVLVKSDVGLGNSDNTSDANKPVSTAQQTALDGKIDKSTLDTNTLLGATVDNTPMAFAVAASRIVGRKATGDIDDMTLAELVALGGAPDGTKFLRDDGTLVTPPGSGTATLTDWTALGNLGATETVTGVDNTFVRAAGTLNQACTITVTTAADQVIDLQLTVGVGGPYQVTWAGVDVWATSLGIAPEMRAAAVGETHRFYFEDVGGTCYGYWLTEPVRNDWMLPTGALGETIPRNVGVLSAVSVLATGRLSMHAVGLRAGQVVSTITYRSLVTAGASMTNQWFALFDKDRNKLQVTNDDTSTAWAAAAAKTLTLASPHTCLYTGLYYLGIVVVGTTMPQLAAMNAALEPYGVAPILNGTSNTGLTNPASCPTTANAITAAGGRPYAYCSA